MKVLFVESHNLDYPDPLGSHQYVRCFRDEGHECLWLGPAISPLHLFKADRKNRHRIKLWLSGKQAVDGIDWLIPLTVLPYYRLPLLNSGFAGRNQYRFCLPPVRRQLAGRGFAAVDLVWCAGPSSLSVLDLVPHRVSCFRLSDREDQFSRVPGNTRRLQEELIKRVDLVLATSRELWRWARAIKGKGAHYLPNGVSDFFLKAGGKKPGDFPETAKKVAVFVGAVDAWFDLETLSYAVDEMQEMHFLVIGSIKDGRMQKGFATLQGKQNFTYLGRRDHRAIPRYLRHCDAALIPFKLTELTHEINPIKYYEYLAAGLPVLASPMRELVDMGGPLFLYRSPQEFCRVLREAAARKTELAPELVDYANNHTWQGRFAGMKEILQPYLSGG